MPIINDKIAPDEERELIEDWPVGGKPAAPADGGFGFAGQAFRRLRVSQQVREILAGTFVVRRDK